MYETGVGVAFLIWIWNSVSVLVLANSKMERNLNKIGQRISWTTLMPKPMSSRDADRSLAWSVLKYLLIVNISLPFILLSWGYVALQVAILLHRYSKNFGAPQAIREFRWKLKNIDMSFDQIVRELMKIAEQDPNSFEQFRDDLRRDLLNRGVAPG